MMSWHKVGLGAHRVQGMAVQRYGGFAAVARLHHWEYTRLAGALVAGGFTAVATAVLPAAAQCAAFALRACCTTCHAQHCHGSAAGGAELLLVISITREEARPRPWNSSYDVRENRDVDYLAVGTKIKNR